MLTGIHDFICMYMYSEGQKLNKDTTHLDTKQFAQKRWRKVITVFKAKNEFQRIAKRALAKKGGFRLLGAYYEKFGLRMEGNPPPPLPCL